MKKRDYSYDSLYAINPEISKWYRFKHWFSLYLRNNIKLIVYACLFIILFVLSCILFVKDFTLVSFDGFLMALAFCSLFATIYYLLLAVDTIKPLKFRQQWKRFYLFKFDNLHSRIMYMETRECVLNYGID